jgi:hypothetical protein
MVFRPASSQIRYPTHLRALLLWVQRAWRGCSRDRGGGGRCQSLAAGRGGIVGSRIGDSNILRRMPGGSETSEHLRLEALRLVCLQELADLERVLLKDTMQVVAAGLAVSHSNHSLSVASVFAVAPSGLA